MGGDISLSLRSTIRSLLKPKIRVKFGVFFRLNFRKKIRIQWLKFRKNREKTTLSFSEKQPTKNPPYQKQPISCYEMRFKTLYFLNKSNKNLQKNYPTEQTTVNLSCSIIWQFHYSKISLFSSLKQKIHPKRI